MTQRQASRRPAHFAPLSDKVRRKRIPEALPLTGMNLGFSSSLITSKMNHWALTPPFQLLVGSQLTQNIEVLTKQRRRKCQPEEIKKKKKNCHQDTNSWISGTYMGGDSLLLALQLWLTGRWCCHNKMTPVTTAQDGFLKRDRQIGLSQKEGRPHPQELLQTTEPQPYLAAGFWLLCVQASRPEYGKVWCWFCFFFFWYLGLNLWPLLW